MVITQTTFGKYMSWYCGFLDFTELRTKWMVKEFIRDNDWLVNADAFVEDYWDDNVTIVECIKKNGSANGAHDVAIIMEDNIVKLESIDYALTPIEKSNAV